jgi:Cd2+/Zn2+-exporting ATPase
MTSSATSHSKAPPANPGCLVRALTSALRADPTLEAVNINSAREKISVATLGRTDEAALAGQINQTVEHAQAAFPCGLLQGAENCETCAVPLSPDERKNVTIQREGDTTTVARVTCPTAPRFWRWRDLPFPKFVQRDAELHDADEHAGEWKWQLLCAGLCLVFGLAAWTVTPRGATPAPVGCIFYALAYLAGSWFAAEELWEHLREQGGLDVHFLMLFVAAGAASIGALAEGATLLFLFSFAGSLEHYALERTQREIRSLFRDTPKTALLVDDQGHEREIAVEKIRPGMRLFVKPGGQFPVDAEISKGRTAADESNLTGEGTPVEKSLGDPVLAGTINLWGAVEIAALRPAAESSLQKIVRLIKDARLHKAPAQRFTDRFSATYTYLIITLSFGMFFVWWLGMGLAPFKSPVAGQPGLSAFYRTMTLLVVSSPCALVLSIPSAVLAAIAWGARHGILIRGGAAVEKLAEVRVVAMDKTGTLTTGELAVEKVESFPPGREDEIARLAYSLEKLSTHPLARAITRHGKQHQLGSVAFDHFESVTGEGLRASRDGRVCRLGGRGWFTAGRHADTVAGVPATAAGFSEVWIEEEELLGRVILRDDIRPQAREVVEELRRAGLRSVVLTGDRKAAAEYLQDELHLDEARAGLKPEEKVAAIRSLSENGRRVAMVGDGVNDAPSLAAAHVGVAMGARGSDAALEQADVVLMHDRLENFLAAFRLSQRARRIIRQNLVISLGTVVVLVTFAALGKIPLPLGVVGHEGSTVVVVMNSLRLLLGKGRA